MLPGGQCRLDRFGFGCFGTVKTPIVHPLLVFGPKGPPPDSCNAIVLDL